MQMKEILYTIRWYLKNSTVQATVDYVDKLLGDDTTNEPELPDDGEHTPMTIAVIVGHEARAPGATFVGPKYKHEYDYNTKLATRMKELGDMVGIKTHIIFRDGVGIAGAYNRMKALKPDCCIELHFNAFNGVASGTETLCTTDLNDKAFAGVVQKNMCQAFKRNGLSRGVKVLSRSARGGGNIYAAGSIANCLVEPFFGDNKQEAELAELHFEDYARSLVAACQEWFS